MMSSSRNGWSVGAILKEHLHLMILVHRWMGTSGTSSVLKKGGSSIQRGMRERWTGQSWPSAVTTEGNYVYRFQLSKTG